MMIFYDLRAKLKDVEETSVEYFKPTVWYTNSTIGL